MTNPIGEPFQPYPIQHNQNIGQNQWISALINIEALVQVGYGSTAIEQIDKLISTLKSTQPSSPNIQAAIHYLEVAKSELENNDPTQQVINTLQNVQLLLSSSEKER